MQIDRRAASRELGLALELLKQDNDLCDKTQQNIVYHVGMAHLLLTTPSARIVRAGHTPTTCPDRRCVLVSEAS